MAKRVIEKQEKQKKVNVPGLIITIILFTTLCLCLFFLIGRCTNKKPVPNDDTAENTLELEYNKLLKVLNDNVNKTKVDGEQEASRLLSFSYSDSHFYISGSNDATIYYYDVDLSSKSLATTKDAYDYVIKNDIEGLFEITIDRYVPTSSSEFAIKYSMNGIYKIGQLGSSTKVFGTLDNGSSIVVLNGVELTAVLSDNYEAYAVIETNSLYQMYKYICNL